MQLFAYEIVVVLMRMSNIRQRLMYRISSIARRFKPVDHNLMLLSQGLLINNAEKLYLLLKKNTTVLNVTYDIIS